MVVLLHEDDICRAEHEQHRGEVDPACRGAVREQQDRDGAYQELQQGVESRHGHMPDAEFVGHQLVGVLAVRLSEVLVEHDAVADGEHGVHSVDGEKQEPAEVSGPEHQRAEGEEYYERH